MHGLIWPAILLVLLTAIVMMFALVFADDLRPVIQAGVIVLAGLVQVGLVYAAAVFWLEANFCIGFLGPCEPDPTPREQYYADRLPIAVLIWSIVPVKATGLRWLHALPLAAVLGLLMAIAPILFFVAAVFTPGTIGFFLIIALIWVGVPLWIMRLLRQVPSARDTGHQSQ
jgi:hypothetical protein